MPVTSLHLPINVLCSEQQVLELDKIATFIGGNGSGKSTILKSIFDEKLKGDAYKGYKIVCFSSGQNESYSENFSEYLNTERAKRNALNLDCFFYDKLWSMLLIFLATTSKKDGEVRAFLKQNNYIRENEFDEDESTLLSFNIKVDKGYINLVKQSLEDENKGEFDIITNKPYHRTLNNFISSLVSDVYDFNEPLELQNIQLNQNKLSTISFEENEYSSFDSKVMFFTQAADNNYFIVKDSFKLVFEKDDKCLHLGDLSDGEYQLLFLYSLIDLFDSENTLFLLDEADSHLHYKNIEKLWSVYDKAQGSIITTTHLLDSIAKAGSERLKIIEKGKIESSHDSSKLLQRLENLSELTLMQHKIASMFKNVVLMDNVNDWEIFKLLLKRKLSDKESLEKIIDEKLSDFVCLSVSSNFCSGMTIDEFGDNKINWLKNFEKALNNSFLKGHITKTENVFLICDGDDFPKNHIGAGKIPLVVNGHKAFTQKRITKKSEKSESEKNNNLCNKLLLSWNRREIKHYLLSFTVLSELSDSAVLRINAEVPEKYFLTQGNASDYIDKDKKIYNEKLARIESKIIKEIVDPYINLDGNGFCTKMAQNYIKKIPIEEISEDILNMYNNLVGNDE